MRFKYARGLFVALCLALLLAIAGCGGGDDGGTGGETAAAENGGGEGGTLTVGMTTTNIPLLDTLASEGEGAEGIRFVGEQLYNALTGNNLNQADEIPEVVPELAESWEPNEDATVWTFNLRDDVTFHDGTPFNADAVIFNFERWLDPESEFYSEALNAQGGLHLAGLKSWRKIDDLTVEITTDGPWAYLPGDLTNLYFGSPTAIQELGNDGFAQAPVGTGPFEFVSQQRGQSLEMKRFENYWEEPAKLDRLILRPLPDPAARVAALRAGEVDWIEYVPPDDQVVLEQEGFQLLTNSYDHLWLWILNTRKPPFDDERVREAINYAIDRESLAANILNNSAEPLYQFASQAHPAYDPANDRFTYDPERARELLAEAGYEDGLTITAAVPPSGSGMLVPIPMNEFIQSQLAEVGIEVELETVEFSTIIDNVLAGQMVGGVEAMGESFNYLSEAFWDFWYGSESGLNAGGYSNPEVDKLIAQAKTTIDPDERNEVYSQVVAELVEDPPWLVVVSDLNPRALAPNVKGFVQPKAWYIDLTTTYVEE